MSNDANWYTPIFKAWQVKLLGPKPTAEQLANIHLLGAKPGKQALACAMATREQGVTNPQILIACGNPQLNKMKGFITDALLKRLPAPDNAQGHKVYLLELTAKGKQRIERKAKQLADLDKAGEAEPENGEAKPAKPAKPAKAPSKPARKLKVKAAPKGTLPEVPTSEPATAAEAVPELIEADTAATDNAA